MENCLIQKLYGFKYGVSILYSWALFSDNLIINVHGKQMVLMLFSFSRQIVVKYLLND